MIPASLHLGSIRTTNILNLMKNIQDLKQPESQSFQQLQELLINAQKIREADQNTIQKAANQQARQLKDHGKVRHPGDICRQIKPLDVLFVKSELPNQPKMSYKANFHGPCLVLAVQPKSEHLILYGLISGVILTKNFKQIRFAFSKEIYSIPLFPHLGDEIQFRMVTPWTRMSKQSSAQNVLTNGTKIISNLHKISHFLAPSLPTFKETQDYLKTIHLSIDEDGNNDNAHGLDDSAHGLDDSANDIPQVNPHDDDNTPLKIYVKPSVSFDPSTKPGADDQDDDNGDNDRDDNGDNDHNGQDDSRVRRPSAPLLGSPPASENLETAPERRPPDRPIRLTRPKKSPPPIDRAQKYSLRKNPTPSKKFLYKYQYQ